MTIEMDGKRLVLTPDLKEFYDEMEWDYLAFFEIATHKAGLPRHDDGAKFAAGRMATFKTMVRAGIFIETPMRVAL